MDLGLAKRACIVTGASRGIGLAIARGLAAEGGRVLLVARGEQELARAADECARTAAEGGEADHLAVDITAAEAAEEVVLRCLERFGRPEVLVNNAGTSSARPLAELTDDEWRLQWELHVMAAMRLMKAAATRMADEGFGRIVNVGSAAGKTPSQTNAAYSVTKAAQLSLSRVFADAYAARGVLVNAVTPGPVATELWMGPGGLADQLAAQQGVSREDIIAASRARVPLGRYATEEEVASAVLFLCSTAASYVAGSAWSVDGGFVPVII